MTEESYSQIVQELKNGFTDEALLMLDRLLGNDTTKEARDFTLLCSRYNSLNRKRISGVLSDQEFSLASNKILESIIAFVQELMTSTGPEMSKQKGDLDRIANPGKLAVKTSTGHERQLIIIEDDYENAQFYTELLRLDKPFSEVVYTKELEQVKRLMKREQGTRVFIVDINLDANKEANRSGLGIVEYIKSKNTKSLVIVYSGHGSYREVAQKIGANAFYEKGERGSIEDDFKVIRSFIVESLGAIEQAPKQVITTQSVNQKVIEENKILLEQLNNSWKLVDTEYPPTGPHLSYSIKVLRSCLSMF